MAKIMAKNENKNLVVYLDSRYNLHSFVLLKIRKLQKSILGYLEILKIQVGH